MFVHWVGVKCLYSVYFNPLTTAIVLKCNQVYVLPLFLSQGDSNLTKLVFHADHDGFFLYARGDDKGKCYVSMYCILCVY